MENAVSENLAYTAHYKSDIKDAVKMFRPLLRVLKIREPVSYREVRIPEIDVMKRLNMDYASIVILVANLENDCAGILMTAYLEKGAKSLLKSYLILNSNLLKPEKEQLKLTGVHEYCHFVAIIYVIQTVSIARAKEVIKKHMRDKFTIKDLQQLHGIFSEPQLMVKADELLNVPLASIRQTDEHYRLNIEDAKIDYAELFRHLLCSKELFDEIFTKENRIQYKQLKSLGNKNKDAKAEELLNNAIKEVSTQKSVPLETVKHQVAKWKREYIE
jgi:hypothetical protein